MTPGDKDYTLFIFDIDNTIFDWVTYYVKAFQAMMLKVEHIIGVPYATLAEQAAKVFAEHGSIEYPFIVQELPAVVDHYQENLDAMLSKLVDPAREEFKNSALGLLKPYAGVEETLLQMKRMHPDVPIVALTDAPRYVAMWKLNKLGLLHFFDAVYGLPDPRLPTDKQLGRVKVDPKILLKHLQQNDFGFKGKVRILPDDYEKPGTRGLKTVLMDYEIDGDHRATAKTLWVGDNLGKDVKLGKKVGVRTVWAKYGTNIATELAEALREFSPPLSVMKNAQLDPAADGAPQPDLVLEQFSDLQRYIGLN